MNFYDVAATALSYSLQSGFLLIVGLLAPRVLRLQHPKSLLVYWRALLAVVLLLPIVLMVWQPRTTEGKTGVDHHRKLAGEDCDVF